MKRTTLILLNVLAVCSAPTAFAQGTAFTMLTITNPTPAATDWFGISVAVVGTDRILIGAYRDDTGATDSGAAYLFNTSGALLTTFTNPTPANNDFFGSSVAAMGADRVLIGAYLDDTGANNAGAAYLFSTNGALLTTFTNPAPAISDFFGSSVTVVGTDRVLIGAYGDKSGPGAAYLFSTNGVLLTTFTNSQSGFRHGFGISVAAVGTERVLIGAPFDDGLPSGGVGAFLFNTNGALLATFKNPNPVALDRFGNNIAAVGTDRVLIGAYQDDTGANNTGAAYLFSTNGTLLTTFTNPTPADFDLFSLSVTSVGTDRVLIGHSADDTGANNAGAAYLFSTNGTLLTTFTNPAPAVSDLFGGSVAAVGIDQLLISAYQKDTGATDAGVVYLFSAAPPFLTIRLTNNNTVAVSWPSPSTDWILQQNTNSVNSLNWSNVASGILDDGTNKTLIVNPPMENGFYRLFKP